MSEPALRKPLRLAAAQFEAASGGFATNIKAHCRLVEEAAVEGATVALFPELSIPGYAADLLTIDATRCVIEPGDPLLDPLREVCRRHRIVTVAGAALAGTSGITLSALVIDRRGEICATYHKQHLDGPEADWFEPGIDGCTIEVDGWRLGLGICYDASFPEHARAPALDGADAYLVSGAFPKGESDHRRSIYFPARALENTLYVGFANFVGSHGGYDYGGRSAVYGPDGRTLADAGPGASGLVVATLLDESLRQVRERCRMLKDRRPEPRAVRIYAVS